MAVQEKQPRLEKLSARALDHAISQAWVKLRRADLVRTFFRWAMPAVGVAVGTYGILTNLPPGETEPETGTTFNTTLHQSESTSTGGDLPYLIPYPVYRPRPEVPPEGHPPVVLGDRNIKVVTQLNIRSVPASKIWHRTAFEQVGDEFWALPDASFRLTLAPGAGLPCQRDRCDATVNASFFGPNEPAIEAAIQVSGYQVLTTAPALQDESAANCIPTRDNLPYLLCALKGQDQTAQEDVCLWLRRAPKGESGNEQLALEVRWERRTRAPERNRALRPQDCKSPAPQTRN